MLNDPSREAFYASMRKHEKDELQVVEALEAMNATFRHVTDQKEQHYGDIRIRKGVYIEVKIDELYSKTKNAYFEIAEIFTPEAKENWNPRSITTVGFPKHTAKKPTIFMHRLGANSDAPWLVYSAAALLSYVLTTPKEFTPIVSKDPLNAGKMNVGLLLKDTIKTLRTDPRLASVVHYANSLSSALEVVKAVYAQEPLMRAITEENPIWRLIYTYRLENDFHSKGWMYYDESIGGETLKPYASSSARSGYFPQTLWRESNDEKIRREEAINKAWFKAAATLRL